MKFEARNLKVEVKKLFPACPEDLSVEVEVYGL